MKSKWIAIAVILLILTIIGIVWYKNKKFLNKVAVPPKPSAASPTAPQAPMANIANNGMLQV